MNAPHNPSTVAQIGAGYWGKNLVRTLAELGALGAIVDDDRTQAESLAEQHGGDVATFDDVLADERIDAVSIATPAITHFDLASRAIDAGKHVFVEKPMALNPREGNELVRRADARGVTLMVGHLLNYHPAFDELMALVSSGRLGRLRHVYSNRLNFGKIRREEDILWSFAPHDISMILRIAGESPDDVSCTGTFALHERIADVTTTHLSFPSGLQAHVFVSWLHPFKEQKLVVVGDQAMAVFDDRRPWSEKLMLFEGSVAWDDGVPIARAVEPTSIDVPEDEPLKREMRHFLDCVATGATPITDGTEGVNVLDVLAQATEHLLAGRSAAGVAGVAPAASSATAGVHPTAAIDDGVAIGENTKVWHFSHVLTGSKIGANCSLGQNVVVGPNVTIGDGCRIQNNVSVYDGVTLEDDVFCGPSMVFTNVTNPRAFVSRKDEFASTLVRRGATIGANATIVCGTTIGEYALVGAGAVVTSDVPAHALMLGVPARRAGWVSKEGEVLDDDLVCPRRGERYEVVDGRLRPVESQGDGE